MRLPVAADLSPSSRKSTASDPDIDAISSNSRPMLLPLSQRHAKTAEGGIAMLGRHHQTMRRLAVAVLVVQASLLAGLSPSHAAARAAAAHSSRTELVDGVPCNDLCKAYMAWSDRMMARLLPARQQAQPKPRTAAHAKKPERTARHAAATRRLDLNSFAQLPRRGSPAPQPADPQPVEIAALQSTGLIADRTSAADGVAERRANADSVAAATEFPETMPISVANPNPPTQEPVATGQVAGPPPARIAISLALALCALLAFGSSGWMSWGWMRSRTRAAGTFR
jgi:hypothetical protein